MEASVWTWGPETFVAVGTILLALVTAGLALSTRRLAKATSLDVEGQWRPILVPVEETVEIFESDLDEQEAEFARRFPTVWMGGDREVPSTEAYGRRIKMSIRNVGPGAALEIMVSKLWEGPRPWTASSFDAAVIPPGEEWTLELNGFADRDRGIRIQYRDLSGRRYSTELRAGVNAITNEPMMLQLQISSGYIDPEIPRPSMGDAMMFRPPGLRGRWRAAKFHLFPPLHVRWPDPLWKRVRSAARAARIPTSSTFTQRLRYGLQQSQMGVNPDKPRYLPIFLAGIPIAWRRFKRGRQGFRGYRGW